METLRKIQQIQFEIAWRTLIHDRFAGLRYRKKRVFKRRRELMLHFPLHEAVTLDGLPMLTIGLAREYAALTDTTLLRDVKVLIEMELVVPDLPTGGYRAHTTPTCCDAGCRRGVCSGPVRIPAAPLGIAAAVLLLSVTLSSSCSGGC